MKLIFVSRASRNASLVGTKDGHQVLTRFLADSKVPTIPHPPYSPDVASPDFFLFPHLKTPMNGHHFRTVDKLKEACTKALKDILEKAYRDAFDAWKSSWKRCIDAGGAYFEIF